MQCHLRYASAPLQDDPVIAYQHGIPQSWFVVYHFVCILQQTEVLGKAVNLEQSGQRIAQKERYCQPGLGDRQIAHTYQTPHAWKNTILFWIAVVILLGIEKNKAR